MVVQNMYMQSVKGADTSEQAHILLQVGLFPRGETWELFFGHAKSLLFKQKTSKSMRYKKKKY